jgi:transcriptional regulator with XRE-family HTH domain
MTPKEYAIELLAKGIPTSQVAAALGVDDSYISQLRADEDVQAMIAAKQAAHSEADCKFDETLERAEMLALEKIEKNMQFATLGQALAAFRILNGARKRTDPIVHPDSPVSVTVNLTLPATALPQYITNSKSEIIEVEGKTMISASPKTLDQILAAKAVGRTALPQTTALEKAANTLDRITTPARQAPRRLPKELSAENL